MPHVELPQAEFKVVVLGDTFAGKTSLVLRFAEGYYRDSSRSATVGASFVGKRLTVSGITCKIQIWDTAGQEQFKKLAPMYYKNAAAAVVCYDCTSPKSFETLRYWLDELKRNVPAGKLVLAVCATKCDLVDIPNVAAAQELADQNGATFFATSAKQNENVTTLFEEVAAQVLQKDGIALAPPPGRIHGSPLNGSPIRSRGQSNDYTQQVSDSTRGNRSPGHLPTNSLGDSPSHQMNDMSRQPSPERATSQMNGDHVNGTAATSNPIDADDNDITDGPKFVESNDSSDVQKTCDSNMLMCGDILGSDSASTDQSSSCVIQ
mmetsp:Transcript_22395/g.63479  ORF Transcript_22395/g.63479 Transcript_22395/m.63479 type:complete len:320 (-) Transcript_22395:299-1258(-)|eukprot:CAMPEP_0119572558 /NCGR_PEP_ID=MMETSP1352-20130426/44680_1 /TAXON_ID=265584 /ORGANISM="Stauroneis constricta, Strain CCMP1120" /LENGTH=319 /DNA_ID=CAMNT_0007622243 /DNA_START=488 /DNA_END=1447 /DNA_ORIENTATION=+